MKPVYAPHCIALAPTGQARFLGELAALWAISVGAVVGLFGWEADQNGARPVRKRAAYFTTYAALPRAMSG